MKGGVVKTDIDLSSSSDDEKSKFLPFLAQILFLYFPSLGREVDLGSYRSYGLTANDDSAKPMEEVNPPNAKKSESSATPSTLLPPSATTASKDANDKVSASETCVPQSNFTDIITEPILPFQDSVSNIPTQVKISPVSSEIKDEFFIHNKTIPKAVLCLFLGAPCYASSPVKIMKSAPLFKKAPCELLTQARLNQRDIDSSNMKVFVNLYVDNVGHIASESQGIFAIYAQREGSPNDPSCEIRSVTHSSFYGKGRDDRYADFCSSDDMVSLYEAIVRTSDFPSGP